MPRSLGPLVGAIDQGTSSTRFLVFAANSGELITYHQVEVAKIYPAEGWVEQDPWQIIDSVRATMAEVIDKLKALDIDPRDIRSIGVCNQRESCIVWNPETGKPYYNSIVWLDNRTTGIVDQYLDVIPGRDINFHKVTPDTYAHIGLLTRVDVDPMSIPLLILSRVLLPHLVPTA